MIRAVLFDADGVVINGPHAADAFARDHGITREMTAPFFRDHFRACLTGKADLKESIAPFLAQWGWHGSVDEHLAFWFRTEHAIDEALLAEVDALRRSGIRCYMGTNQELHRTAYIRNEMGLAGRFDHIYSSAEIGHCKPDAAFFEHILRDTGVAPAEMFFIDDTPANVEGARACGMPAEVYTGLDVLRPLLQR